MLRFKFHASSQELLRDGLSCKQLEILPETNLCKLTGSPEDSLGTQFCSVERQKAHMNQTGESDGEERWLTMIMRGANNSGVFL